MGRKIQTAKKAAKLRYSSFEQLDGSHPWQEVSQEGYINYPARRLNRGQVLYFNYPLAKEMGLISADHRPVMNPVLEKKLIETFSIQIINEYDEIHRRRISKADILPKPFMATRYLQLQHSSRQGRTSGDGRGIWNGTIKHRNKIWDVSSRGTGVTRLAPGSVDADRPLQTGSKDVGYGCGLAEIDELVAAAVMSEAIHLGGVSTERTLCVIDLGEGVGIGVRAAPNLLRPAHILRYLKQGAYDNLKTSVDYLIQRQLQNREWSFSCQTKNCYWRVAEEITESFAQFSAHLEADYIFAWMDWDGDNLLINAGILDYGSVRQFGARHDQYRYDDVERFSTNLNEQKAKAKLTVQNFIQIADFLHTGEKKKLPDFARHKLLTTFDLSYEKHLLDRILYRAGFEKRQRKLLLSKHLGDVEKFYSSFQALERLKHKEKEKLPDGINRPPLFNLRCYLRKAPALFKNRAPEDFDPAELCLLLESILCKHSSFDEILNPKEKQDRLAELLKDHHRLTTLAFPKRRYRSSLAGLIKRAERLNGEARITGNALIQVVEELLWAKKRGLSNRDLQSLIDRLLFRFVDLPETAKAYHRKRFPPLLLQKRLFERVNQLIDDFGDDI